MDGDSPKRLRLKIDPAKHQRSGSNLFSFDTTETFFFLSERAVLEPNKLLLVKGKVVIPQIWKGIEDDVLHVNTTVVDTQDSETKVEFAGEIIELPSPKTFATLAKAGFGDAKDARVEMAKDYVKVSVDLFGEEDDWKRAAPQLVVTGGDKSRTVAGAISNSVFTACFYPHAPRFLGKKLKLEASS